jgi:hypothetical protein
MKILKQFDNIQPTKELENYCDSLSRKFFGRYDQDPFTLDWNITKEKFVYKAHLKWNVGCTEGNCSHQDPHLRSSLLHCLKKANRSYNRWRMRQMKH